MGRLGVMGYSNRLGFVRWGHHRNGIMYRKAMMVFMQGQLSCKHRTYQMGVQSMGSLG